MTTIVTRTGKGAPLSWIEADANFTNLNLDKVEESELASATGSSMVGYLPNGTGAVTTTIQDKLRESVSVKDFGAVGDGVTDDRLLLIDAMQYCASAGITLFIPDGTYLCSNWLPLPSGLKMEFAPGAIWKLTAGTTLGGFVCGGYNIDLTPIPFEDVDIYGINLDCNSLAGENGFNALNANGVRLYSPKVKNALFSETTQGGKAFQFEGATVDGVHIYSPYIEDCTIGINSHADPYAGTEVVRHVSYYDVVMRNVDVPFNIDGRFVTPEDGVATNMSTFVHGVNLFDCGKLTFSGATSTGGGIICGDRGYGLKISGLRLVNTATYGSIGGLVRGTMFDVDISDVRVEAPGLTAVFNFELNGFGGPSSIAHPCRVVARDITVLSNLDYIVKSYTTGKVGKCLFENIDIDSSLATLIGICDVEATYNGLGYLNLRLINSNYNSTGLQSLVNLYAYGGNSVTACLQQYSEGVWTPIDASGAGLSFTISDTCRYVKTGRLVTAVCKLTYPATANSSYATIGGLPFTAASFSAMAGTASVGYSTETTLRCGYVLGNTTTVILVAGGGAITNATLSTDDCYLTISYLAA